MGKCLNCDEPTKKDRHKFCSRSCSVTYNNVGVRRNYNPKRHHNCKVCGTQTTYIKYCSMECRSRDSIIKAINGEVKNLKPLKKHLILNRGHQCEECKHTKWLNSDIPLELEHIDGNSNNNDLKNLKLLCPNCHTFTLTYKGRNKNSSRNRSRYYKRKNGI
jgi:hypothetical protein